MWHVRAKRLVVWRVGLLLLFGGLAACTLPRSDRTPADVAAACEPGNVEQARAVVRGIDGIALGPSALHAKDERYEGPTEAEVSAGMLAAVAAARREEHQPAAAPRLGTAYLVRLTCGGVVYVFEEGSQRFEDGRAVAVRHGLFPTLHDR